MIRTKTKKNVRKLSKYWKPGFMGEGGNKTQREWIKNWGHARNWDLWVGEGI